MANEDHILDIMNLIKKHYKDKEDKAALFFAGDADLNLITADVRGNPLLLSEVFNAQMTEQPEFNALISALFGAYLTNNPDEKEKFIAALELTKNEPNLN